MSPRQSPRQSLAPSQAELQQLLYQASAEPLGLLLLASDPAFARQKLYEARKAAMDPELDRLQFRLVEFDGGNLAIVRGAKK